MMISRLRVFVLFLYLIPFAISAQPFICGTQLSPAQIAQQQQLLLAKNFPVQYITTCLNKTVSVKVHIIADSLYNPGITPVQINNAIAGLNARFSPICLSFQVCDIDTLYEYKFNRWDISDDHPEFQVNHAQENVINFVLVDSIENPGGASGYAPLAAGPAAPPQRDLIPIVKGAFGGKTLAHEVGHFFGLYHTFETSFGLEFANMSNCATTGDLLCDTYADIVPDPPDIPGIAGGCIWNMTTVDPNGDQYTPILGNIMSYHYGCPLSFTTMQYNKMIFAYLNYRNYLY